MCREVGPQPGLLRGALGARDRIAFVARVQRDQVPAADVEAVVALVAVARPAAECTYSVEVVEVALGAAREVLVIARRWKRDRAHTAPAHRVALGEARVRAARILEVPNGSTPLSPAPTSRSEVERWRHFVLVTAPLGEHAISPAAAITGSAACAGAAAANAAATAMSRVRRRLAACGRQPLRIPGSLVPCPSPCGLPCRRCASS